MIDDAKDAGIPNLVLNLYNKQFDAFTESDQEALQNSVTNLILKLHNEKSSAENAQSELNDLMINSQNAYYKKFLSELAKNDFTKRKCQTPTDMDFKKLVYNALKEHQEVSEELRNALYDKSDEIQKNFKKHVLGTLTQFHFFYCNLKFNGGADFMMKATSLLYSLNREGNPEHEDETIRRIEVLLETYIEILDQNVKPKLSEASDIE